MPLFRNARAALSRLRLAVGENLSAVTGLVVLSAVAALFEMISAAAIIPFVSLLAAPKAGSAAASPRLLTSLTGSLDPKTVVIGAAVALIALFVLKNVISGYVLYAQFRFGYRVQMSLMLRVLAAYFARDYEYFLGQNSAVLLKNVTQETGFVSAGVVIPVFQVLTDAFAVLAILATLVIVNPGLALTIGPAVTLLFALVYIVIRRRLVAWAAAREAETAEISRLTLQALAGVKEAKLLHCEDLYLSELDNRGQVYARLNTWYQTFANLPRLPIELFGVIGLACVVVWFVSRGLDTARLLATVSLYGFAAYRIMPSFNRIFSGVVTARYYWPSIEVVTDALASAPQTRAAVPMPPVPVLSRSIRFDDVSYRYPGSERSVVDSVSLEIARGSRVALVGRSGAGKTTAIDLLLGLLEPATGSVLIDNVPLTAGNRASWHEQVGYVAQQVFIADTTLRRNIAFGVADAEIDDARVLEAIHFARLDGLLGTLDRGLDTGLGEHGARLSGGERQRVAIARALYRRPRVLILDEATSALDVPTEREINADVVALGRDTTVVIVTHRLESVQSCDCLFVLTDGHLVAQGPFEQLLKRNAEFAAIASRL